MTAGETEAIRQRYIRRTAAGLSDRYSFCRPEVYMAVQELERALIRWIRTSGLDPIQERRILEIGCGDGGNILELVRLGFTPRNIVANEMLPQRIAFARARLSRDTELWPGDASELAFPPNSFDVVLQCTVFTSILDDTFQARLAARMWQWVKPGGGVLWYDFVYDNPRNPDVRGMSPRRIRELFPDGRLRFARLTLAPPISRAVVRIHPCLYTLFNAIRPLRTHVLAWIQKH